MVLSNTGQENQFYDIPERKNAFLDYKKFKNSKKKIQKFKKIGIFFKAGNPWFQSQIGHFSIFFFLGNRAQENVFYDIQDRKNAFLDYKNQKFKKSKNCFWLNYCHSSIFLFLGNTCQENVFYNILERKNTLLKNSSLKSQRIKIFPNGLNHGFVKKVAIFPSFCFQAIEARKICCNTLQQKNAFLGFKIFKFKKSKH